MKNCHEDEKLQAAVGQRVRITFFDGKASEGILQVMGMNNGYKLECPEGSVRFYKTHVKKLEIRYGG